MVHPGGFEPPTARFVAEYSIQLSYGCIGKAILLRGYSPGTYDGFANQITTMLLLLRRIWCIREDYSAAPRPTGRCLRNVILPGAGDNFAVGAYLSDRPLDVDELLQTLGLYEHRKKLPNQLSGGQQQRTAIGRAIVKNPDILLCDEPTGALDYNTSKDILELIERVNQKYGNTVIMVTHNDAIKDMADIVIRLRDGAVRKSYRNEKKIPARELDW